MIALLAAKIRELPDAPGIYVFLGDGDEVLYVGKAKSLRKRVPAYQKVEGDARLLAMVEEARDLDFVVAGSEADALQLENTWIKSRQPRYNVRLKDDKTYPYLKLTLNQEYPRLVFTRKIRNDGAEYYGPFLPAGLARRGIRLVQKYFGIRVCDLEIDGKLPRPCLYWDTKRCLGPCVNGLVEKADYATAVEGARAFLSGRNQELVGRLRQQMLAAAERQEFEVAARHRDAISELESLLQRRQLSSEIAEDADVYGLYLAAGNAAIVILVVRDGKLLDRREFFFEGIGQISAARLLAEVLPQVYEKTAFLPREIHLPLPIAEVEGLEQWLSEKRGGRLYVQVPARGRKAHRTALATENARQSYRRRFRVSSGIDLGAVALRDHLGLTDPPSRIEGFDISTHHGDSPVGSLVCWIEGKFSKRDYRSFNIRHLDRVDDFASMRQTLLRHYRRVIEEGLSLPDLILIDGGRGQLNSALAALTELGIDDIAIASLAKRQEEIYSPGLAGPLRLPRTDDGLRLLQRIRDEAHRFAIGRHRRQRQAGALRSRFDDIRGIGEVRRKLLVRRFGSFRGVEGATEAELSEVLGSRVGTQVFLQIHREQKPGAPDRD